MAPVTSAKASWISSPKYLKSSSASFSAALSAWVKPQSSSGRNSLTLRVAFGHGDSDADKSDAQGFNQFGRPAKASNVKKLQATFFPPNREVRRFRFAVLHWLGVFRRK